MTVATNGMKGRENERLKMRRFEASQRTVTAREKWKILKSVKGKGKVVLVLN
jgi:hypothetical protein